MERRNENEFVLTKHDIIYSLQFWAILFIAAVVLVGIKHNYLISSILIFAIIKYFGSENLHFHKNKLAKLLLRRYPYTIKVILSLFLIGAIMMSWFSFKAFICSVILSICWNEYMKLFTRRKSLI